MDTDTHLGHISQNGMSDISGPKSWNEFSQETSMHGIKNIGNDDASTARRVAWLLLTFVGIGYFCYAGGSFLNDCAKKLISTKIRVEQTDIIKFPTVTVCNQNMFLQSYIQARETQIGSDGLSEILFDLYDPINYAELPPPLEKYRKDDPKYTYFHDMSPTDTAELLKNGAHPLWLSLLDCNIFGHHVPCGDVFEIVPTDAGYCYQFNGNGSLTATAAGKKGGLQLHLNAAVMEYTFGPDSASEGFTFTFHEAHEVPLVRELGIGIEPGVQASIQLHKSETTRYPPWSDGGRSKCFDTEKLPNPLLVYKNYSRSACQVECETTYVIERCNCRDPRQPALNRTEPCGMIDMLYCSQPALNAFAGDPKGLASCGCRDPCIDSEYSAKVSTCKFPSANYVRQKNQTTAQYLMVRNNMMMVNIFYGKLYYTSLTEELAYGWMEALSNIGGTLGLCVGASLLTVMEYLEFGILSLISSMKRFQNKKNGSVIKVTPTPQHVKN